VTAPLSFEEPEGATPLDPDDAECLIPTWIANRGDLNKAEQANITRAIEWTSRARSVRSLDSLLTLASIRELHKRMFEDVWSWAGEFRRRDTNLGTRWPYISTELTDLLADVATQTAEPDRMPWTPDEVAARFHHRLVVVHPFPNGNGRHSRLAADLLVGLLGRPVFTWGSADLGQASDVRARYIAALQMADRGDFDSLVEFARS